MFEFIWAATNCAYGPIVQWVVGAVFLSCVFYGMAIVLFPVGAIMRGMQRSEQEERIDDLLGVRRNFLTDDIRQTRNVTSEFDTVRHNYARLFTRQGCLTTIVLGVMGWTFVFFLEGLKYCR